MRVVVNTESDEREVLGLYVGVDEDAVVYQRNRDTAVMHAPYDCVKVVEVTADDMRAEVERLARRVQEAGTYVGDGTAPDDAMNMLVDLACELNDYASAMGAILTVDQAYADLRRRNREGYRVGACAVKVEV